MDQHVTALGLPDFQKFPSVDTRPTALFSHVAETEKSSTEGCRRESGAKRRHKKSPAGLAVTLNLQRKVEKQNRNPERKTIYVLSVVLWEIIRDRLLFSLVFL